MGIESAFNKTFTTKKFNNDRCQKLASERYLKLTKWYLKNITDKLNKSCQWRTQRFAEIAFRSSKVIDEYPDMDSWSDNWDIKMSEKT